MTCHDTVKSITRSGRSTEYLSGIWIRSRDAARAARDRVGILALLDRMNAFMASGDWDAQRAQFADDADIAMIGSADFETFLGAQGVDRYFEMVRDHNATASFTWRERRVWAHGDVAWAYADAEFRYTFDGSEHTLPYRFTLVCRREDDGGWRIVLYHGSEPAVADPPST